MIFFIVTIVSFLCANTQADAMENSNTNIKKNSYFYSQQLSTLKSELNSAYIVKRKDILYQLGKASYLYSKKLEAEGEEDRNMCALYLKEAHSYFNTFLATHEASTDLSTKIIKTQTYLGTLKNYIHAL